MQCMDDKFCETNQILNLSYCSNSSSLVYLRENVQSQMDKHALDCQSRNNHYICVCRVFNLIALRTYRLSENMVGAWNSMNRINRTIKKVKQVELSNLYINNPLPIENHQILRWLSKAIL